MSHHQAILRENIFSEWGNVIHGAAGHGRKFFGLVDKFLKEYGIPRLTWTMTDLAAKKGFLDMGKGEKRIFLIVSSDSYDFLDHYVGATNYGNCLAVSRYLGSTAPRYAPDLEKMDLFEIEELTVFNTVVHGAVVKAVHTLMEKLGQDTAGLRTKATNRAFLEEW